ncbi:sigma-70 family RNA polymerase sigma factor [Aquisphaera insulae]|uniref:sigma-70 family RNA polymerase sigma factor n=1 Tax=Aquisphaera insulae TaxID=2712864 RepID=UPI0013EC0F9D|nr:sigma-70 family RNA polymerase sigma factor [Aquisphaera insulae]
MSGSLSIDAQVEGLLADAARGDPGAMRGLLEAYRDRLRRMISARLDRRLAARLDPSDVVQETLADAARRLPDYLRDRPMPFYAWLFRLASDRLAWTHRDNLVSNVRAIGREERIDGVARRQSRPTRRADQLADPELTPCRRMVREERRLLLSEAIGRMEDADREILSLRYVDRLAFEEVAAVLAIGLSAAKMRHMRALERLRPLLEEMGVEPSTGS